MHNIKLTLQTGLFEPLSQTRVRPVARAGDGMVSAIVFPVIARAGLPTFFLNVLFCLVIFTSILPPIGRAVDLEARGLATSSLASPQPGIGGKPLAATITLTLQTRSSDPYFSWIRHGA